ncbi:MAG: HEPN domain-containing protein [Melioribacteraceae bacterium]|nr:HEPN domain-containing protein [Melioribacteraceae bacterium]MCF8354447.1 HEPN domain-containing protein [Melioribacteraceae bacterium]MCF8394057.1 HEPN domain-containing protein [Melioribacteraceae bacterium]MCF8419823.1 HEPN domain-containing protein [Melioribacteraceae bacterium]
MNSDKSKLDYVQYRRDKAHSTIDEIKILFKNDLYTNAVNRIYYAGFYIVSSLLLLDDFSTSKHIQLIGYFNKKYVKRIDFQ